jgi:twinfilin-like protein
VIISHLTEYMAASSGITVGPELAHAFATACSEAKTRVFKVELKGETLSCACSIPAQSSDADDFALLQSVLVDKQACYICYRMDSSPPCCWIFVMYVPNGTSVRDRMLYAATREATKSALGGSAVFCHEMHCGAKDELTYASYSADISSSAAPAPKTDGEMLKEKLKLLEIAETSSAGGGAGSSGANVAFPLSAQAKAAIVQINSGSGQWITAFNVRSSNLGLICFLICF